MTWKSELRTWRRLAAIKHRLAKLEKQLYAVDVPPQIQPGTPPDNLTPAEQQAFAERYTPAITMRTLKKILRNIDGKTTRLPSLQ